MIFLRFLVCYFVLGVCSQALKGNQFRFDRLNSEQGLSNNWVRCFHQDDKGFIWIGTADGLNRYDGHSIKTYRVLPPNGDAVIGTTVNSISRKGPGQLWVSTDIGVYIYREKQDRLFFLEDLGIIPVFEISEDKQKRLWFSTRQGLYRRLPGSKDIQKLDLSEGHENQLMGDYVNRVFQDSRGRIWVCSKSGMLLYQEDDESFRFVEVSDRNDGGKPIDVLCVDEDQQGRLWLGLANGDGVSVLVDDGDSFRFQQVLGGDVVDLEIDQKNLLWAARGVGGGLVLVDLDEFKFGDQVESEPILNDKSDSSSVGDSSLFSVFEDRAGDIWIGSFGNGVSFTSRRSKPFLLVREGEGSIPNPLVNSFLDEENFLWIGTEGGLSRLDKRTGVYRNFNDVDEVGLGTDPVFDIIRDSYGELWVATWRSGLNRLDETTQRFKQYLPLNDGRSLGSPFVFSVFEDSDQELWVGMIEGGICRYDRENDCFIDYSKNSNSSEKGRMLNSINDISQLKSGEVIISSYAWLNFLDTSTGMIDHLGHSPTDDNGNNGGHIVSIFKDSFGLTWLATQAGLELFDPNTREFRNYTSDDGLAGNSLCAILEDEEGNLWISSGLGLTKFERTKTDPTKGRFRSINYGYGIAGAEFKKRAAFSGVDGKLYFGTSKGYVCFDPAEIRFNEVKPTIVISEVSKLISNPNSPYVYRPISKTCLADNRLELDHVDGDLRFEFSVLNFLNPEANQYRYRMIGYDSMWIDAGNNNVANYTSIDPGEYVFEIMGANNDGLWADEPYRFYISVRPPWWEKIWFRTLVVLSLLLLVVLGYRLRIRILNDQQTRLSDLVKKRTSDLEDANKQLAEKQSVIEVRNEELALHKINLEEIVEKRTGQLERALKKAEHSDRLKSAFLANLSHEIRTPMNAIVGFSALLKSSDIQAKQKDSFIDVIDDNCQSLLVLIDDILDLSMIDSSQLEVVSKPLDVDTLLEGLYSYYTLNNHKKLEIVLDMDRQLSRLWMESDPVRFKQVISNLLSNAYKFTSRGKIVFGYRKIDKGVRFFVEDSGYGIKFSDQKKVFDRFFKVDEGDGQLFRGTGLGLAICSEIVRLLGGQIKVQSVYGEGSKFWFDLHLGNSSRSVEVEQSAVTGDFDFSTLEVLVAEDDDTNFQLIGILLERRGAKVVRAKNGLEAVAFFEEGVLSDRVVVLMDLKMPYMDGYEASRKIHVISPHTPIVALTAFAQREDRQKVLDSGFDGYIAKPIKSETVFSTIESVVLKFKK